MSLGSARAGAPRPTRAGVASRGLWAWPLLVFLVGVLTRIGLPGLYMDAVNPDFLAVQWLHPHLHNPSAGLPSKIFPILGNLYHGVQNAYVALPIVASFGPGVASLRLAQAVFGAILLLAFYGVVHRLGRSTWLGFAATLGLATELAFVASFRTQFYIVMGGAAWLFVSLWLLLSPAPHSGRAERRIFWAGCFSGLAGYGYFVLFFFVPGMLAITVLRDGANRRQTVHWLSGLALGLAPFALGYLSLLLKLHGLAPTLDFIRSLLGQLQPFSDGGAKSGHLGYAWRMAGMAISDAGNEAMIFGQPLPGYWGTVKLLTGAVALVISLMLLAVMTVRRDPRRQRLLPALLPVSFLLTAMLFGHRLWAHHFCILVPFAYLLPWCLLATLADLTGLPRHARTAAAALLTLACVTANLGQQWRFQQALSASGGYGMATEALNRLGLDARGAPADVAYVFPEWGFFTSFCLLTGNRVRYAIDMQPATLAKLRQQGYREIRLFYWNAGSARGYEDALRHAGLEKTAEERYATFDGNPAFYGLRARWADH